MGSPGSDSDEAITKDEIQGVEPPQTKGSRSKNAFTELMRPKPKAAPAQDHSPSSFSRGGHPFKDRMGLGAYLADPSSFPSSRVIYHTPDFVVINDLFPKSTIHTLLLPRSPKHNLMHPFDALEDADFRAKVVAETGKLKALVASELRRRLGHNSRADAARQAVLDGDDFDQGVELDPADGLPRGRDWSRRSSSASTPSRACPTCTSTSCRATCTRPRSSTASTTTPSTRPSSSTWPTSRWAWTTRGGRPRRPGICTGTCGAGGVGGISGTASSSSRTIWKRSSRNGVGNSVSQ
uniref:HIT domain-containing protein n=1 Tax=Bionectria ochroleuca TaxID=29856 RepID=A0A8H7NG67_BIOOC